VKREAFLASQETRSPANDEIRKTNDEPAGRPTPRCKMLDRKTLNSFLPTCADLPPRSDRILSDEWIRGKQHTVVLNGLADQHAIKRVSMQQGKFVQVKNGSLVQRERGDPMSLTLFHNKAIERTGERQLAQGMLDREFPN
jgi:hypothetical protein